MSLLGFVAPTNVRAGDQPASSAALAAEYRSGVRPVLERYCLGCHSEEAKKGDLDLARFTSIEAARSDVKPWQAMIEMLETGSMPPKKKPQPTAGERGRLIAWVRDFLDSEARARAGDPGLVGLRRLSNAEYDATVRDLTGVDLRPTREFPADGAAGEGFTNAAEALGMSPALLAKYLKSSKEIASHAVLLPDGIRFSSSNTRRDWTDEIVADVRRFYADFTGEDGKLPLQPYLAALVRHREELSTGKLKPESLALSEKLSPKYLAALWTNLNAQDPLVPLDRLRSRMNDVGSLLAEVTAWQAPLWRFQPIGSYRYGNIVRQVANEPALVESLTLKSSPKPEPGQADVVLYLVAQDLSPAEGRGSVVWQRPRFERNNQPALLLRDYAEFGPPFEIDYNALFAGTPRYLAAAIEAANHSESSVEELARKRDLDVIYLNRWIDLLAVEPFLKKREETTEVGKPTPLVSLELLDEPAPSKPTINGWKKRGTDLPILITNSSNQIEQVPGRVSPHQVAVHPTPSEFVAVVWKSPLEGKVQINAKVVHAHPACGNGVAWWLERRKGDKASVLAEGTVDLGKETTIKPKKLSVAPGDLVMLAVDARDGNHVCDLTEIAFSLSETEGSGRKWDLAADVADTIGDGNPHADKLGNKAVWSFVKGPSRTVSGDSSPSIPSGSILERWREVAADPKRQDQAGQLGDALRTLLAGVRPADEKHPDRKLYDTLVSLDGPLLRGLDLSRLRKTPAPPGRYGLEKARFGKHPEGKAVDEAKTR